MNPNAPDEITGCLVRVALYLMLAVAFIFGAIKAVRAML